MVVFCQVAFRRKSCSNLHDSALQCYWMCQLFGQKSRWGVVSLPFHMPVLGAQRLAKWLSGWKERMSLLVVAEACAPSMLTEIALKQGHCWEEIMLVAMEVTWESQGGLRWSLRSPRGLLKHSLSSGDARAPSVSLAEAKRRARAWQGVCLCGLDHHKVVSCGVCVCFLFLVLAAKKVVCEWMREPYACVRMAVHVSYVTQPLSTRKQPSVQQRGGTSSILRKDTYLFWRLSGSQWLSKYFVNAAIGQSCPSTHASTHRASTRTATRWPRLRRSSSNFFWTAWTFFYLCHRDAAITLTPTTISHSWLVWLSLCSGWDERPGLSKELGWPPSPSPPARSYRFTVVKLLLKAARLCPSLATRVIRGHTPNPNFLWSVEDCEEKLPCPHANGERLGHSLRFRSLGLLTSQVIVQSKIRRDVGRCHGEQEGRIDVGFFANFIVGKDKSMVKFSFLGVLAL